MATRTKVWIIALWIPFNGLLIWGMLSASGIENAPRIALDVAAMLAPMALAMLAGISAWYWLQQRALRRLSPEEQDTAKSALRSGEWYRLALILPLMLAASRIPPLVFGVAVTAFIVGTSLWLARKLAHHELPSSFVRSYLLSQTAALWGIAVGFALMFERLGL